jgi:glycosyltransferase involved in cell wall biosynthesis
MAGVSGHLLAVSWATLPAVFPRSIQVARSLKALRAFGWESTVVSAEPSSEWTMDPELEAQYTDSYRVVRVQRAAPPNGARQWWRRLLRRPVDPDSEWIESATGAARTIVKTESVNALITFAQPWSDHVIGLRVARATRLPWIAHFSDPWAASPYNQTLSAEALAEARKAEKRVVETADVVVFPTARMADLVMAKYRASLRQKVAIVPHGFETLADSDEGHPRSSSGRLRIVHAGDFYGSRTPASLIDAIAWLCAAEPSARRLELVFLGLVPPEHQKRVDDLALNDVIRFDGRVSYTEAARAMASADALLVIDAPSKDSVFLPSKLVDYLAFSRPIIGLTPKSGASADLLARLGCPHVEPDDVDGIEAVLRATLDGWRRAGGSLRLPAAFRAVASEYEIERTTSRLNDAIEGALERKGMKRVWHFEAQPSEPRVGTLPLR